MAQPTRLLSVFVATLAMAGPAAPPAEPPAQPAPVLDNVDLMDLMVKPAYDELQRPATAPTRAKRRRSNRDAKQSGTLPTPSAGGPVKEHHECHERGHLGRPENEGPAIGLGPRFVDFTHEGDTQIGQFFREASFEAFGGHVQHAIILLGPFRLHELQEPDGGVVAEPLA